jgi:hypothetical protein
VKRKRKKDPIAVALGKRGGQVRAKQLNEMSKKDRVALAKKAAQARWAKKKNASE